MTTTQVCPQGLSKELQERVNEWADAIARASKKTFNPYDAFDGLSYEEYLCSELNNTQGLDDKLHAEMKEREDELKKYGKELMSPLYERQLKKDLEKAFRIRNLSYHDSMSVGDSSYQEETQIVRVPNGLIYKFYTTVGEGDFSLVSSNFVECTDSQILNVSNRLMHDVRKNFVEYISLPKIQQIYDDVMYT